MISPNLQKAVETLKELPFPALVIVEISGYCQLKCVMCPYKELDRAKGIMDFSIYKKIADEISNKYPNTQLWLAIMGEPLLLGKKLMDYVKYAKDRDIEVILNTNGMLLDVETFREFANRLDKIIVGLDAYSMEVYRKIRVGGDFDRVKKNILGILGESKKLKLWGPEIVVQFITMDENKDEVEQFKKYWLGKGATVKIRKRLGWGDAIEGYGLDMDAGSKERIPCPWLMRTISIEWNGNIAQCDADYEGLYKAGNIKENSIEEIWNGELKERRSKHWDKDFDFTPCNKCNDWQVGVSDWFYP